MSKIYLLQVMFDFNNFDIHALYCADLVPAKIEHSYDYNGKELELYTGKLPKDSPLIFLSKYFKGEIKLKNISWMDIECGKITLNENKSFRDVPEIMEQMKGDL